MKTGFIIPIYNHGSTINDVVESLLQFELPIILIDDGNDEKNRSLIQECASKHKEVSLVTCKKNGGKGKAMNYGVLKAYEMGLSHVFQIDADGQHNINSCENFLALSKENPSALIIGYPEYDETVPDIRKNGRAFSNNWGKFVSLNFDIKDVLCGFRIYPVLPYIKLLKRHAFMNKRMGYDVDILVHLSWMGIKIINAPVLVTYPKDGFSNFKIVRDNIAISLTFARLCIGMILRLPKLIVQNVKKALKA